jgi:hypothetical protein
MSVQLRKKPPATSLASRRGIEIIMLAHNQALHYLAIIRWGMTGGPNSPEWCTATLAREIIAAREGSAWLRERYRERGEVAPF